jgi:hypothetical protein
VSLAGGESILIRRSIALPELWEIAKLIRSKNASPWELTFDIMFDDVAGYETCRQTQLASPAFYARLYNVPEDAVRVFECPTALAIKATIPRPQSAGAPSDTDVFGGQFHSPFVRFAVPDGAQR